MAEGEITLLDALAIAERWRPTGPPSSRPGWSPMWRLGAEAEGQSDRSHASLRPEAKDDSPPLQLARWSHYTSANRGSMITMSLATTIIFVRHSWVLIRPAGEANQRSH